jgi:hypothetical protein
MGAHFSGLSLKKWPPGRAACREILGAREDWHLPLKSPIHTNETLVGCGRASHGGVLGDGPKQLVLGGGSYGMGVTAVFMIHKNEFFLNSCITPKSNQLCDAIPEFMAKSNPRPMFQVPKHH